jgi:hypothetical protein
VPGRVARSWKPDTLWPPAESRFRLTAGLGHYSGQRPREKAPHPGTLNPNHWTVFYRFLGSKIPLIPSSPVRANTRQLPNWLAKIQINPAAPLSMNGERGRGVRSAGTHNIIRKLPVSLCALRVFAVKNIPSQPAPSHHHPQIFTQKNPKISLNRSRNIGLFASKIHPCRSGKKPDGHDICLHALALAPPAPVPAARAFRYQPSTVPAAFVSDPFQDAPLLGRRMAAGGH